jgi:predicted methyltransferase
MTRVLALLLSPIWLLAACDGSKPLVQREPKDAGPFPAADRPVASIVSARWSNEEARDRLNEAGEVMTKADIRKGMTVADIGAGEGYYTIRAAARVV